MRYAFSFHLRRCLKFHAAVPGNCGQLTRCKSERKFHGRMQKAPATSYFRHDARWADELTFEKHPLVPKCSGSTIRSVPTVTLAGALIGRDSELATLVGLMTEVAAGRGGAVLIEGEPGIGKSSLVRAALAEARHRL